MSLPPRSSLGPVQEVPQHSGTGGGPSAEGVAKKRSAGKSPTMPAAVVGEKQCGGGLDAVGSGAERAEGGGGEGVAQACGTSPVSRGRTS